MPPSIKSAISNRRTAKAVFFIIPLYTGLFEKRKKVIEQEGNCIERAEISCGGPVWRFNSSGAVNWKEGYSVSEKRLIPLWPKASKYVEGKMKEILQTARNLQSVLIEYRRRLHRLAELSGQEGRTSVFLAEVCNEAGWKTTHYSDINALTVDIGDVGAKRIGLRADIDALPGPEESGLQFAATGEAAHLCGHDMHIAMVLGAALIAGKLGHKGLSLRLIFQHSEEMPPGGALELINRGAVEGLAAVFGLHVNPMVDVGNIMTNRGALLAAADNFEIVVKGRSGHAASPHTAVDSVLAASSIVTASQAIVSRMTDPASPLVVSFTSINGGKNHNIFPDEVKLLGTVRSYSEKVQLNVCDALQRIAGNTVSSFGATAELNWIEGYPPLVNDPVEALRGKRVFESLFDSCTFDIEAPRFMFGEDFGRYIRKVPGAFFFIGAGVDGERFPLHNSRVRFNEDVLWRGAAFLYALATNKAGSNK